MKVKLLTTISFFTYQLSISQSDKLLHGKVLFNNKPLRKVEVINKTAKTSTTTNDLGEFSIAVKVRDSLLFFSKDFFFTRIKLTQENIDADNLMVNMVVRPEELNEVVITNIKFDKIKYDAEATFKIDVLKRANDLTRTIPGYKDGTIANGMSLAIPFGNGKPKKDLQKQNDFKKLITKTCPPDFFTKDLKLNAEEVSLYLEFCDADPRSKTLLEHSNILTTMDFLYAKNEEFKKLKTDAKN
ncbi:transthyretin-like family protein [Flavobacterium poyangense]|uniref:hypothetical protein n=1 Tax=Flavobacterium poyangense TaxID=2204302 RepID=UPI00141EB339|nr:hypothetical protein [Flavobacterium sp. JXAS1]